MSKISHFEFVGGSIQKKMFQVSERSTKLTVLEGKLRFLLIIPPLS